MKIEASAGRNKRACLLTRCANLALTAESDEEAVWLRAMVAVFNFGGTLVMAPNGYEPTLVQLDRGEEEIGA